MAEKYDESDGIELQQKNRDSSVPPVIQWSDDIVDLERFENGSGLPQVVKYEDAIDGEQGARHSGAPGSLPTGLKIYSDQPVLFYTRTSKRHVSARTIYHDKEGPYFEVGQTLTIPGDFEGE